MSTPYPKSIDDIGKESTNIRERDPLDDGVIDRPVDTTITVPVDTKTPDYIKILGILGILVVVGIGIYFIKNPPKFNRKSNENYIKLNSTTTA